MYKLISILSVFAMIQTAPLPQPQGLASLLNSALGSLAPGAANTLATVGGSTNLAALTNTGPQTTTLMVNNPQGFTPTSNALASGASPGQTANFGPLSGTQQNPSAGLPDVSQLVAQGSALLGVPVSAATLPLNPIAAVIPQNQLVATISQNAPGTGATAQNIKGR